MNIEKEDIDWTDEPVIGMALLFKGGSIDSCGNPIDSDIFYKVGKHKESGMVAIIPTDRNQKDEIYNDVLKKSGQLN